MVVAMRGWPYPPLSRFHRSRPVRVPSTLRLRPVHAALLAIGLAAAPSPAAEVRLTAENLVPIGAGVWMGAGLDLPAPDPALPLVGARVSDDVGRLLRRAAAQGQAQGFAGILYDNRDRGHSTLAADRFPRLTRLAYGADLRAQGFDYGLAGAVFLPAIVFGNSSTAITSGSFPRSLPRLAMTWPDRPNTTARLYRNNHLYVYPEHRDHDAVDRFPANWPYMIVSQGSSGSDRVFLEAIAATLAAFRPDTFDALRRARLVAPTVQMILRRNLAGVNRAEEYFTGIAHPVVIAGDRVRPGRMVGQAAAMAPDAIPPLVRLRVEDETFRDEAGLALRSERLFDTPQGIARLWRDVTGVKEMVVSTAGTIDPNGRDLTFRWVLLQGDPDRVTITPLDPAGRTVRIQIRWHDPWTVPARIEGESAPGTRRLSRVDIAVFAENGATPSAPAFVTVDFPAHQVRRYGPETEAGPRLLSIDYDAAGRTVPFDPALYWTAPWIDEAISDARGAVTGWRRIHADRRIETVPRDARHAVTETQNVPTLDRALDHALDRARDRQPDAAPEQAPEQAADQAAD